jgi:putative redox protein
VRAVAGHQDRHRRLRSWARIERDDSEERQGTYRLRVMLDITGELTDAHRQQLLAVAEKCPLHRLMTQVTTEIRTELAPSH